MVKVLVAVDKTAQAQILPRYVFQNLNFATLERWKIWQQRGKNGQRQTHAKNATFSKKVPLDPEGVDLQTL